MNAISTDTLLAALRWRYATKQFDPARRINDADWAVLEQVLILTPSSFGLQPWKFIVITDQAIKDSLVPVSWGQRQLADASHIVVFAGKTQLTETDIDAYMALTAEVRGSEVASLAGFRNVIWNFIQKPPFGLTVQDWITRQAYIALGNLMTAAATLGIDTCPMEGFDPVKYDEILGLRPLGLRTIVTCPVGYRAATDKYATAPKVRFKPEDLILRF